MYTVHVYCNANIVRQKRSQFTHNNHNNNHETKNAPFPREMEETLSLFSILCCYSKDCLVYAFDCFMRSWFRRCVYDMRAFVHWPLAYFLNRHTINKRLALCCDKYGSLTRNDIWNVQPALLAFSYSQMNGALDGHLMFNLTIMLNMFTYSDSSAYRTFYNRSFIREIATIHEKCGAVGGG